MTSQNICKCEDGKRYENLVNTPEVDREDLVRCVICGKKFEPQNQSQDEKSQGNAESFSDNSSDKTKSVRAIASGKNAPYSEHPDTQTPKGIFSTEDLVLEFPTDCIIAEERQRLRKEVEQVLDDLKEDTFGRINLLELKKRLGI